MENQSAQQCDEQQEAAAVQNNQQQETPAQVPAQPTEVPATEEAKEEKKEENAPAVEPNKGENQLGNDPTPAPKEEEKKEIAQPAAPAQQEEAKETPKVEAPKAEAPVEGAIEPVSQQVSNPVETTKEGASPSNSQNNTPVNRENKSGDNVDKVDNPPAASSDRLASVSNLDPSIQNSQANPISVQNSSYSGNPSASLKLFVGGLYFQTEDDVLKYFQQFGEVVDCQLLRHRQTGRSRGFAFVTLNDPDGSVANTILSRRNEINGKFVDVKKAEDNKTREKVEKSSCKVFVGGIEGSITTEELKDFFENFGRVKEAVVLRNINTNASRGFGFVTFEDSDIAHQLIRENNCVLKGKRMDIKPAEPKDNASGNQRQGHGGGGGRGRDYDSGGRGDRGGSRYNMGGYNDRGPRDYYSPPDDYRGGGGRRGGGYEQRNYPPRDKYAPPDYDYMPRQYEQYPPPAAQPRYGDYPPQPIDPPTVATIAPYAPPAPVANTQAPYKGYQQPVYPAYDPQSMVPQQPKSDPYNAQQHTQGYGDASKYYMYGDPNAAATGNRGQGKDAYNNKPNYQYGKNQHSEQYLGGPARSDYQQQNKHQRYKPY